MEKKLQILSQVICPECGAVIITPQPEAMIWERCPSCKQHVWDANDVLMAERVKQKGSGFAGEGSITRDDPLN